MNIQFGSVLNEQNSFVIWDEIGQGIFTVPKLPTWFRKHLRGSGSIDLKGFRSEKLNLTTWCCTRCFEGLLRSAFNNVKLKSLQAALGKEKQAEANYSEWTSQVERLKERVAELVERIERLTNAKSTLEELQTNHSLKNAMEDALQRHRTIIEEIFARIHSPAEFLGLGSDWATLRRKADSSEAKLSEISTGQRAAFALSIFLAQNAQLTMGPPIILIDDPIAHVDDLNALSFLDYLREVSLAEKRQIFFATANDKLATLFEHKFDFLGQEGFRRFDLRRDE